MRAGRAGAHGPSGIGMEDGGIKHNEGLHYASLVRVIHQRGQRDCGPGGSWTHQRGAEHDTQIAGAHFVVVFKLRYPEQMNKLLKKTNMRT